MFKNVFRFELRKLLKSPLIYVCFGIMILFLTFDLLIGGLLTYSFFDEEHEIIFETNPIAGQSFLELSSTILLIFFCIYLTRDFADGTIKNIYGRGVSRTIFYFVRFLVTLIAGVSIFLLYTIIDYVSSSILVSCWKVQNVGIFFRLLGLELLNVVLYCGMANFVCSFAKKVSNAIIVCILGPVGVLLLLEIGNAILVANDVSDSFNFLDYWFESYQNSYYKFFGLDNSTATFDSFCLRNVLVDISWFVVFGSFGWLISSKDKI